MLRGMQKAQKAKESPKNDLKNEKGTASERVCDDDDVEERI